ncbi:MAG: hypothetical protein QM724_13425 [Flavobacteriales bacterium]
MKKPEEHPPQPAPRELILDMLVNKSGMKQDVYHRTTEMFNELKQVLQEVAEDLDKAVQARDTRIHVRYTDKGEMAAEMRVAGDTIIFNMHTNVFRLDQGNSLWKTSYLEEDELRGYFGVINVYNFLSDSFKYNRERDLGYLVARLFLNKEGHFFVQGKRQLGFLYNDIAGNDLDREKMRQVVQSVILYVLDFDLLAPPYDQVNQVTVLEMNELNANMKISTGKRLGFRFQTDVDEVV